MPGAAGPRKIERALNQACKVRPTPPDFVGLRSDVRTLLADMVAQTGGLALVLHFYEGDVETERFSPIPSVRATAEELRSERFVVTEDQIVLLSAK